ncbi:ABC transporter permease subunit [Enterococcus alishanensis]|uniref:ABC transporter permease subunit n=1 Tax=Enterococcus alishanensis TaxID=1303817 RepID=A0ABS6TAL8_9ENTE|nr:ABC transporter permease subunit [Enterococcus alishanensis]MBV7389956.1 ABC transporter permease subunit [Enterococcus alishanensis]
MNKLNLQTSLKILLTGFFLLFLFLPVGSIFFTAFPFEGKDNWTVFLAVFNQDWQVAFANSLFFSILAATIATLLAFLLAYGNNFTGINQRFLKSQSHVLQLPMLMPTITYGFVLIYAFGTQGLWGKYLHHYFSIYGPSGVVLGFIIYILPPLFLLMNNSMRYLDTRLFIISRLMQDNIWQSLKNTILQPMLPVIVVAFLQGFFMSFTDFGIPTALAGQTPFITTLLYEGFMGTIPNFQYGAMIALTMLLPSIISIYILNRLQKKVVAFDQTAQKNIRENKIRDCFFASMFLLTNVFILGIFAVLLIIPFVKMWPYDLVPTMAHFTVFRQDQTLLLTLKNSLLVAGLTAIFGTILAYTAALFTAREKPNKLNQLIDSFATVTNSIPGMVLGIAYLLLFSGTALHNGLPILIFVTMVHYFATPYQMAKDGLQKMNQNWENTGRLMGDSWLTTIRRVLIPNSKITLLDMFSYYFVNGMVTISALIFLTSANTMVMTAKLKELQHFGRFNDIFFLSLSILIINILVQGTIQLIKRSLTNEKENTRSNWTHYFSIIIRRLQQLASRKRSTRRQSSDLH